jgi:hypothetical protein
VTATPRTQHGDRDDPEQTRREAERPRVLAEEAHRGVRQHRVQHVVVGVGKGRDGLAERRADVADEREHLVQPETAVEPESAQRGPQGDERGEREGRAALPAGRIAR